MSLVTLYPPPIIKRSLLFLLLLLLQQFQIQAQCPDNIDFEHGNFDNWELKVGTCCPISTPSIPTSGGRHTIMSGVAFDPYGGFPTLAPGGDSYSLKLGNNSVGAEAERARYYIHVPAGSSSYILVYRYAVVLEDPGHLAKDQPRFEVVAYDSLTNSPLECNTFSYVASSILPGFVKSTAAGTAGGSVYYKPWTTGTLDLTGHGGKTIAIDFASGDCALSGHFGYGYVDMNCGLFQVYALQCNGSPTISLNAPTGYAHYKWMNISFTKVIDTLQNTTIPTPSTATQYAVILTPYTGFGCADTLYTTYVVANTTANAGNDTTICLGQSIDLYGTGSTNDGPLSYSWTPIKDLSCFNCQRPRTKPFKTSDFALVATSKAGCSDTDIIRVTVDTVVLASLSVTDDSLCLPKDIDLKNNFNNPPLTTYNWSIDGPPIMRGGTRDSMRLTWSGPGTRKIKLSVSAGNCNSQDSLIVAAGPPIKGVPLKDTFLCYGSSVRFTAGLTTTSFIQYQWEPASNFSCMCDNPTVTPTRTGDYILRANNEGCVYRDTAFIRVDTVVFTHLKATKDTLCIKEPIFINSAYKRNSSAATYKWGTDGATTTFYTRDSAMFAWGTSGVKKVSLYVNDAGCTVGDSLNLFVRPNGVIVIPASVSLCYGDSFTFRPVVNPTFNNPRFYWSPVDYLSCFICDNPVCSTPMSKKYTVMLLNESSCTDPATVMVNVDSNRASLILPDKICQYDSLVIRNTFVDSVRGFYTWTLDTGQIFPNKKGSISAKFDRVGKNKVILKVRSWRCNTEDTVDINVLPAPIANAIIDDTGCINDTVVIKPDKINGYYKWAIDEQDIKDTLYKTLYLKWKTTGRKNVTLVVRDTAGCKSIPFISAVDVYDGPGADISKLTEARTCEGDELQLTTREIENCKYQWLPASSFRDANKHTATMRVGASMLASVVVTNEWGCESRASTYIDANDCCKAFLPDAFTPNNDGHNDTYHPLGIEQQQLDVFMIANRWGQIIYNSNDVNAAWDGRFKNQIVEPGTYFYYLKFICNNKTIEQKGDFLLLR